MHGGPVRGGQLRDLAVAHTAWCLSFFKVDDHRRWPGADSDTPRFVVPELRGTTACHAASTDPSFGRLLLERGAAEGWGTTVVERCGRSAGRGTGDAGFSPRNLAHMRSLVQAYPIDEVLQQRAAKPPRGPATAGSSPCSSLPHARPVSRPTSRAAPTAGRRSTATTRRRQYGRSGRMRATAARVALQPTTETTTRVDYGHAPGRAASQPLNATRRRQPR